MLFSSWKPLVIMIYMNSMLGAMISKAPILHKSQNLQFAEKLALNYYSYVKLFLIGASPPRVAFSCSVPVNKARLL